MKTPAGVTRSLRLAQEDERLVAAYMVATATRFPEAMVALVREGAKTLVTLESLAKIDALMAANSKPVAQLTPSDGGSLVPAPRKRGRPRKNPVAA